MYIKIAKNCYRGLVLWPTCHVKAINADTSSSLQMPFQWHKFQNSCGLTATEKQIYSASYAMHFRSKQNWWHISRGNRTRIKVTGFNKYDLSDARGLAEQSQGQNTQVSRELEIPISKASTKSFTLWRQINWVAQNWLARVLQMTSEDQKLHQLS